MSWREEFVAIIALGFVSGVAIMLMVTACVMGVVGVLYLCGYKFSVTSSGGPR